MPFDHADFTRDVREMVAQGDRVPAQREWPEFEAVREVLAEHFIMWRDLGQPGLPPGEWFCSCGRKFGFSDSAIDHVTETLLCRRPVRG